jgi:hypothetical protein
MQLARSHKMCGIVWVAIDDNGAPVRRMADANRHRCADGERFHAANCDRVLIARDRLGKCLSAVRRGLMPNSTGLVDYFSAST